MTGSGSLRKLSRLNLNLLLDLDAILSTGSLTAAAQHRFVTQSAMSGALSKLRRVLGDEILVRVGRDYQLTSYALDLRTPLRESLLNLQNLIVKGLEFDPTVRRTFTIAASDYVITTGLASLLADLTDKAVNVSIRHVVPTKESYRDLDEGEIDAVIAPASEQPATRNRVSFLTDPYVFMFSRGSLAPGEALTLDRFKDFSHVTYGTHGLFAESISEQAISALQIEREIVLTVESLTAIPFILAGTSLGAVVPSTVCRFADLLGLEIRTLPFEVPSLREDLVWHRRSDSDPGHTWLRNQIIRSAPLSLSPEV